MQKLLLSCLFFFTGLSAQLDVGDPCGSGNEKECALVDSCPEAIERLMKHKPHGLERCGFLKKIEIVCCTKKKITLDSKGPLRKTEQACMKYWKDYQIGTQPFIVRGINASAKEFPHMAALGYLKETGSDEISWGECGGALISYNFVLTAAHCIVRVDGKTPVVVRLGKIDLFGNADNVEPQDIPVTENIPFPQYKHLDKINDIALVKLERSAKVTDYVKPVCLYTGTDLPSSLVVTGWGATEKDGNTSRFLLKAYVENVHIEKCNKTYLAVAGAKPLFDTQLCALSSAELPSDTCQGDSGGPIQVENKKNNQQTPVIVVGVTSYGRGCGGQTPSVYTKVSPYYLEWIETTVWPN